MVIMRTASELSELGFAIVQDVVSLGECDRILAAIGGAAVNGAGSRTLLDAPWCGELAGRIRANVAIASVLPEQSVAVQCTYFDKSAEMNWLVALHQDLSIPVRERIASGQLSGWAEKEGQLYVQPPKEILETLIGVRIHLDECGQESGPLRVVPTSHRHGRLSDVKARDLRNENGEVSCIVPKGGALILKPLLLHASSKASAPSHRRVLHLLFGPPQLPHGLEWARAI
jgi:hypothetical protein